MTYDSPVEVEQTHQFRFSFLRPLFRKRTYSGTCCSEDGCPSDLSAVNIRVLSESQRSNLCQENHPVVSSFLFHHRTTEVRVLFPLCQFFDTSTLYNITWELLLLLLILLLLLPPLPRPPPPPLFYGHYTGQPALDGWQNAPS